MDFLRVEAETPTAVNVESCLSKANPHLRLGETEAEQFALGFKALSNPIRLQILDLISQGGGQICGCDIECYFELTQPTISHHLKVLREAGLISSEPRGVWMMHRINESRVLALQGLLALVNNTER